MKIIYSEEMTKRCLNQHEMADHANFCEVCGSPANPDPVPPPTTTTATMPPPPPGKSRPKKTRVLIAVSAVVILVAAGTATLLLRSGDSKRQQHFAEMVEIIESFEAATEKQVDGFGTFWQNVYVYYNNFVSSFISATTTDAETAAINAFDETIYSARARFSDFSERYSSDVLGFEAELFSIKLEDETLRELRTAAVDHFGAWRDENAIYSQNYQTFTDAYLDDLSFGADDSAVDDFVSELWETDKINANSELIGATFDEVCTLLSDAQPADNSYRDRIIDICDD